MSHAIHVHLRAQVVDAFYLVFNLVVQQLSQMNLAVALSICAPCYFNSLRFGFSFVNRWHQFSRMLELATYALRTNYHNQELEKSKAHQTALNKVPAFINSESAKAGVSPSV